MKISDLIEKLQKAEKEFFTRDKMLLAILLDELYPEFLKASWVSRTSEKFGEAAAIFNRLKNDPVVFDHIFFGLGKDYHDIKVISPSSEYEFKEGGEYTRGITKLPPGA